MNDDLKGKVNSLQKKAKKFSVLYVEDEPDLREKIALFLRKIFPHVDTAADGKEGLEKYLQNSYDIVITDILMPKMNGLELIRNIRQKNEKQEVIVISAYTDSEYLTQSIQLEVTGYIIKPVNFDQALKVLEQSIDKLSVFRENEMYKIKLETMVQERTREVLQLQEIQVENYEQAIHSFVKMIEGRDTYTGGHSERVASYSRDIAKDMGLKEEDCELIYEAGILHDIGKIMTPDAILLKPGALTDGEYGLIKEHATAGYEILVEVPMYKHLAEIVYAHHERYDGGGYPRGLKAEEIPLLSRIMSVADTFDAMTTSRIYKSRKTTSEAIQELKNLSGVWYDPLVIKSAVKVLASVEIEQSINQEPCSHMDDERFAYFFKDPLTHAYNHFYLDFILQKSKDICLNIIYIKKFTLYNQQFGWSQGDEFLINFVFYLQNEFNACKVFRIFGDDFVLLKETHQDVDIDKINALPQFKDNNLYCEKKHFDLRETKISSYKELQEEI
ncbi:MAG: response regulator [Sulfurimonas sp.]|nr:response regulator [Sulfurimonas sp.]